MNSTCDEKKYIVGHELVQKIKLCNVYIVTYRLVKKMTMVRMLKEFVIIQVHVYLHMKSTILYT